MDKKRHLFLQYERNTVAEKWGNGSGLHRVANLHMGHGSKRKKIERNDRKGVLTKKINHSIIQRTIIHKSTRVRILYVRCICKSALLQQELVITRRRIRIDN